MIRSSWCEPKSSVWTRRIVERFDIPRSRKVLGELPDASLRKGVNRGPIRSSRERRASSPMRTRSLARSPSTHIADGMQFGDEGIAALVAGGGVARLEGESGGAAGAERGIDLAEVAKQGGLNIVGRGDENPLAGVREAINAGAMWRILADGNRGEGITAMSGEGHGGALVRYRSFSRENLRRTWRAWAGGACCGAAPRVALRPECGRWRGSAGRQR